MKITSVFSVFCVHAWYCGYPRTVLSFEQGLPVLLAVVLRELMSFGAPWLST